MPKSSCNLGSLGSVDTVLQPNESRFVMFPVKHNDVWDLYKITIDCFRKAEDIDLSRDYDMHIDNARS